MSASNWAICPKCKHDEENRITELRKRAAEAYGTIPVEEFDALRAAAEIPEPSKQTFREDYKIYGAETGEVTVSYSGHCEVCGTGLDFEIVRGFYSRDPL